MSNINAEFKEILETLEKNMKNKDDLELVKVQMFNLYNLFFDEVTNLETLANSRMAEMAGKQKDVDERLGKIEKEIKNISVDIYGEEENEDEEDYNFTIECPYCNFEFNVEVDELENTITCPECKKDIELDWGHDCDEEGCAGCDHHCYNEDDDM